MGRYGSSKNALQVSEIKTNELLERMKKNFFPDEGSKILPTKQSMFFSNKANIMKLVMAIPGMVWVIGPLLVVVSHVGVALVR